MSNIQPAKKRVPIPADHFELSNPGHLEPPSVGDHLMDSQGEVVVIAARAAADD